jgi:phage gpG-like protein
VPRFLDIEIAGAQAVRRQLLRGAETAMNMRPALLRVREDMFRVIRLNFTSQGRRGGGSWKMIDTETAKRKAAKNLDPRILMATHKLMDSFTKRESRYMRSSVTRDQIKLDSTLPYASTHQYGDDERGIPARPFITFLPNDRMRWVKMCERELIGAMRGR